MNGGTYKTLLVILAVGGIVGGAWALDARMDAKDEKQKESIIEVINLRFDAVDRRQVRMEWILEKLIGKFK